MSEFDSNRRKLLKVGLTFSIAIVAGCAPTLESKPEKKPMPFAEPERLENQIIKLEQPEPVYIPPLDELPDIQTPFFYNSKGEHIGFVTSGKAAYRIQLEQDGRITLKDPSPVIEKDITSKQFYRNGYVGISSVIQPNPNNPDFLVGSLNYEQHAKNEKEELIWQNFRGRVGYGISTDAGKTWDDRGVIIEGYDPIEPNTPSLKANNKPRPTGAIHPWFLPRIIDGQNYLYTYYTDLTSNKKRPNQICLSRCIIDQQGNLGTQELFAQNGQFVPNGEKQEVEPKGIFPIPEGGIFTSIPSVYPFHDKLIGLFQSENGFYISLSQNGTDWSNPIQIVRTVGINQTKAEGGRWFGSPSLVSLDANHGYLLYSDGIATGPGKYKYSAHQMKKMKFEFAA